MKKLNLLKVAKIGGMLLSVGSMLLTSWVSTKENEKVLKELVDKKLEK